MIAVKGNLRGRWSKGIEPRSFCWIITGRLAVCERPGGYGPDHRPVRRQEEIIWLLQHGFERVLSLMPGPFNLHSYQEYELSYLHVPYTASDTGPEQLLQVLTAIRDHAASEQVVVHHERVGEQITGLIAAYLLWTELIDSVPSAIMVTEQLLKRELGPQARELVAMAEQMPPSSELAAGTDPSGMVTGNAGSGSEGSEPTCGEQTAGGPVARKRTAVATGEPTGPGPSP